MVTFLCLSWYYNVTIKAPTDTLVWSIIEIFLLDPGCDTGTGYYYFGKIKGDQYVILNKWKSEMATKMAAKWMT